MCLKHDKRDTFFISYHFVLQSKSNHVELLTIVINALRRIIYMLKLVDIRKDYVTKGVPTVTALQDINICFRKNEFVSILGPSGSGKTTLLNIIGGLDHYTSGDLVIAGKSTKDFKDRDWDFYRNQRIGFIFQSYNLIPHQTVLANVELALTISGVSKQERTERAKEALNKVGLHDQYHKRPNQLSGGQCQRVAIARALVNNPEILLADEPTGALDTKTSEQIMELIKEISKDRLVIMVTHNPDLADRYSNRILRLLDGRITEDSNPFTSEQEEKEVESLTSETVDKKSKAKMGLTTATKLSFRNLISKKGRTILVAIASSIGIIGVSTVLSVSFGVTNYVDSMQDDMLSSYPLTIAEQSVDLTSLMTGLSSNEKADLAKFDVNTQVGMQSMIEYLMDKYSDFTKINTNDINNTLIDYVKQLPEKDVAAIQYNYGLDVTNNIFTNWTLSKQEGKTKQWMSVNGLTQRYISELKTVGGFERYATYVDLFTNFMKEMPGDEAYITSQYDLLGNSKFASSENEMMIVTDHDTTVTDLLLGQLGIYDHDSFINIGKKAVQIYKKGEKEDQSDWGLKQKLDEKVITRAEYDAEIAKLTEKYPYDQYVNYDELIGREFYYLPHEALWDYGNVSNDTTMTGSILIYSPEKIYNLQYSLVDLTPINPDLGKYDMLSGDEINITDPSLSKKVTFARSASANRDPETFFDGDLPSEKVWFEIGSMQDPTPTGRGLSIGKTGDTRTAAILNLSDMSVLETYPKSASEKVIADAEESDTVNGYYYHADNNDVVNNPKAMKMTISGILRPKKSTNFGSLTRGIYYNKGLSNKYMSDAANAPIITDSEKGFKQFFTKGQVITSTFGAYCKYPYLSYKPDQDNPTLKDDYAFALNGDFSSSMSDLFSSFLGGSDHQSANVIYMRSLSGIKARFDTETLSASFDLLPQEISIYPKDFASKDNITKHLDRWNSEDTLTINGEEVSRTARKDLTYTDTVAMIITVIKSLITIVTSALVAFTSLSLVVSCFMIAVITYISVMERVKEIGVIRSLGGRKRDVTRLFTAENFITGLASGIIGISVTYLLSILINVIVHFFGAPNISMLPWWMALIMVALAIFLNVISGLIPSQKAAKQDPVVALRSE